MKKLICIFVCLLVLSACVEQVAEPNVGRGNRYSHNFEIRETAVGYDLSFPNNAQVLHLSREISNSTIKIPVESVVCLSTTYSAFISQLGETSTIKGISGTKYVCDTLLQSMIKNGNVLEVGYDKQLDMERIISLSPDVVFAFGVDSESSAVFGKLDKMGIPVVFVDDYKESKPLGRTEWIKFFSCFYDKYDYACEYFDSVENNYLQIKNLENDDAPVVLVSMPWKGTWWVPGGDSFFANFIKDAGGKYIFDNESTESTPLSIETVFSEATEAQIWLHPNEAKTRAEILNLEPRLEKFPPYHNARIYNNNKLTADNGGSDFWESGVVHPDIILNDLHSIFNSDSADLHYYIELK